MSLRVLTQGGGAGGEAASIFVTGLSETDKVSATHKIPAYVPNPNYVVPEGYTQLEYIKSTGTQYINTDVPATSDLRFEIDFITHNDLTTSGFGDIFGARNDAGQYVLNTYPNSAGGSFHCQGNTLTANPELTKDKRCQVSFKGTTFTSAKGTITTITTVYDVGLPLCIFGRNFKGTIDEFGKVTLYSLKLYSQDTLIRNYVPVKRGSDSIFGLYDTVNDVFHGNSGTGEFIAGAEVPSLVEGYVDGKTINGKWKEISNSAYIGLPDGYTQLEYIESTGSQYFSTGVYNQNCRGIVLDCQFLKYSSNTYIAGIWQSAMGFQIGMLDFNSVQTIFSAVNADSNAGDSLKTSFDTDRHLIGFKGGNYILDDEILSGVPRYSEVTYNQEIPLFSRRTNGSSFFSAPSARIYRGQLYGTSEELIRDYIPCRRNSDGAIGFYDLVNGTFGASATSTAFIAGSEVHPIISYHIIEPIKDYGMWAVAATDGVYTARQDVLVDAALEYKIAMSYDRSLTLYNYGDECEDVTGGWVSVNPQTGSNWSTGTATKNEDNLYLSATGNYVAAGWTFHNEIDVTNYTKLKAVITGPSNYNFTALYTGTIYVDTSVAYLHNTLGTEIEIELDVSAVTGAYKILLSTWGSTLTIYKVWLE